jgi:hypothetical protein
MLTDSIYAKHDNHIDWDANVKTIAITLTKAICDIAYNLVYQNQKHK